MTTDYDTMSGPQLTEAYNAMAVKLGKKTIKKFRTRSDGIAGCKKLLPLTEIMKVRKNGKAKFGSAMRITVAAENPRRKGTLAYSLFEKMSNFVASNPQAFLSEVMAATGYRRQDFDWDRERGSIKVES